MMYPAYAVHAAEGLTTRSQALVQQVLTGCDCCSVFHHGSLRTYVVPVIDEDGVGPEMPIIRMSMRDVLELLRAHDPKTWGAP